MIDNKVIRLIEKAGLTGYMDIKAGCEIKKRNPLKQILKRIKKFFRKQREIIGTGK